MKKLQIRDIVDISEINDEPIDKVIESLQRYVSKYGPGELDISVDSYGDIDILFTYMREETEVEYQTRIKRLEFAEQAERRQYERLKAKFEGGK